MLKGLAVSFALEQLQTIQTLISSSHVTDVRGVRAKF